MADEQDEEQKQYISMKLNPNLMKASAAGDLATVEQVCQEGAEVRNQIEGWTALSCAAANGHADIVRYLITRGAADMYRRDHHTQPPVVGLGEIKEGTKLTPLLWACQKGHWRIMCILLKENLSWDDIDMIGNTAIHLAASSNTFKTVEILLERGVDITRKNSRGHTPIELTTNTEVTSLLKKNLKTDTCPKTGKKFSLGEIKYLCHNCRVFVSAEAKEDLWSFFDIHDKAGEQPLCLCKDCRANSRKTQNDLISVIEEQDEHNLRQFLTDVVYNKEKPVVLDVRIVHDGERELEKLKTQNEIKAFIKQLDVIDNYKTILKSQEVINQMLRDADDRKVIIDKYVLDMIDKIRARLNAERDLRKFLDYLDLSKSDTKTDLELGRLIAEAEKHGVAANYITDSQVVKDKMSKTLDALRILEEFLQYETRPEYPIYPVWNRQKQKYFNPVDNKVVDITKPFLLNLDPAICKKMKKKWALKQPAWVGDNAENIKDRITMLKGYLDNKNLTFEQDFTTKAKTELTRMTSEYDLMKRLEKDQEIIDKAKKPNRR